MSNHSSILAWEIPWTEEPGQLQSMGLLGVREDLAMEQQQAHFNSSCYNVLFLYLNDDFLGIFLITE